MRIIRTRFLYVIMLFLVSILPWATMRATDVEEKRKELENIEKQIQKNKDAIQKAEERKKQTSFKVSDVRQQKQLVDQNVKKLSIAERIAQLSFQESNQRLENTESELEMMQRIGNEEFLKLFYLDYHDRYVSTNTSDKTLLSLMTAATVKSILNKTKQRDMQFEEKEEKKHEFIEVRTTKIVETRKGQQYIQQMKKLQGEVAKLDREKEQYLKQIDKLRQDARELERLISKLSGEENVAPEDRTYKFSSNKLPWPVRGRIIRDYGEEKSSLYNTSIISNGIDIAVPEGTAVISVDNGEVVYSDRFGGQGKLIIIDHKNGFFSLYAYNSSLLVSKGQQVKKGQTIARSGNTGSAKEPSLHFELRRNGKPVNPLTYLQ